jgi:hypothetical protein
MNPLAVAISRRTEVILTASLLGICLSSCATTPHTNPSVQPAPNAKWVKVRNTPPTWCPRGTPAGCATDGQSGEWVDTGDAANTRFFIPFHGPSETPRRTLVNEALAARNEWKKRQIIDEDRAVVRDIALAIPLAIIATPLLIPMWPFIAADQNKKENERTRR